jgi:hypothetical protein
VNDDDKLAEMEVEEGWTTIHLSPPEGSGLFPCCGKSPFEVPRSDRVTLDAAKASCSR